MDANRPEEGHTAREWKRGIAMYNKLSSELNRASQALLNTKMGLVEGIQGAKRQVQQARCDQKFFPNCQTVFSKGCPAVAPPLALGPSQVYPTQLA